MSLASREKMTQIFARLAEGQFGYEAFGGRAVAAGNAEGQAALFHAGNVSKGFHSVALNDELGNQAKPIAVETHGGEFARWNVDLFHAGFERPDEAVFDLKLQTEVFAVESDQAVAFGQAAVQFVEMKGNGVHRLHYSPQKLQSPEAAWSINVRQTAQTAADCVCWTDFAWLNEKLRAFWAEPPVDALYPLH